MALKKSVQLEAVVHTVVEGIGMIKAVPSKVQYEDCYIKVSAISGNKDQMGCVVEIQCTDNVIVNKTYGFTPNLSGDNFIKQAYIHLKTLPDFAGAEDC
jgi:hypothetical protein